MASTSTPFASRTPTPGCDPEAVEATFGDLLPKMKWVNFGGGHHVTRPGYDLATLEQCICQVQEKYGVQVYLEPGEAWASTPGI